MKSMSMDDQGIPSLNWVCRWRNGFCRAPRPAIHILAGENVCIQVMRPTHASSAFASRHSRRISSGPVSTGLTTTLTGIAGAASRPVTIAAASSATVRRVSGPYRCCEPVTNQTSLAPMSIIGAPGLLTVLGGVALVEARDDVVRQDLRLADLQGGPDRGRDVLGHDRSLDRRRR